MDTKKIIAEAKKLGLCKEWLDDFQKNGSLEHLCEKFFEGSDWALENNFPSLELLKEFPGAKHGLHLDYKGKPITIDNAKGQLAFFGKSKAEINVTGFAVLEIYARHDSKIKIKADNNAIVKATIIDNASVQVECTDEASASVFIHGDEPHYNITGKVNVLQSTFKNEK